MHYNGNKYKLKIKINNNKKLNNHKELNKQNKEKKKMIFLN